MYNTIRNVTIWALATVLPVGGGCATYQKADQAAYEIDIRADMARLAEYQRNFNIIMRSSQTALDNVDKVSAMYSQINDSGHQAVRESCRAVMDFIPNKP